MSCLCTKQHAHWAVWKLQSSSRAGVGKVRNCGTFCWMSQRWVNWQENTSIPSDRAAESVAQDNFHPPLHPPEYLSVVLKCVVWLELAHQFNKTLSYVTVYGCWTGPSTLQLHECNRLRWLMLFAFVQTMLCFVDWILKLES